MNPAPEVVLFDLGGVLMDFGGLQRLAELTGEEDGPALHARWITSPWVQAFERGACDAESFAAGIVADFALDLAPTAFLDDFARWSAGPYPGARELVRRLKGTVRTGCLSNTNAVHWQRHLDRWGIVEHFDWTFTSYTIGAMKPDPAVFDHVIRTIGTEPDRLLFLDDTEEHVRAAIASGMRAERTRGLREVEAVLRSQLYRSAFPSRAPERRMGARGER